MSDETTPRARALPPGQRLIESMPVHHIGDAPAFDGATWALALSGEIDRPRTFTLRELTELATIDIEADFHAASGWSVARVKWRGARLADVLAAAHPRATACFVHLRDEERYDASLSLYDACQPDVLLAVQRNGEPLPLAHGGPLRVVAPAKYAWKSVKWLRAIEVTAEGRPGFWERRGFHPAADPWRGERFV